MTDGRNIQKNDSSGIFLPVLEKEERESMSEMDNFLVDMSTNPIVC